MTIEEAIKHCEEVAEQKDLESGFDTDNERYIMTDNERADCKECAYEHRQLAEWLKELKQLKEQEPILDKIKAEIDRQEKWLMSAGYNAYNVDIAFNSIKSVLSESEVD